MRLHTGKKRHVVKFIGLGKAIEKTLSLALRFQDMGYDVNFFTGTKIVIDDVDKGDGWTTNKRLVSEIIVSITVDEKKDHKVVLMPPDGAK